MTPHVRRMVGELNAGSMLTLVTGSDEKPLTGWTPRPIVKFIFDFFCSCNDDLIEEMNHSWGHLNRPLYIIYHNCIPLSEVALIKTVQVTTLTFFFTSPIGLVGVQAN